MKLIIVNNEIADVAYCKKMNDSDVRSHIVEALKKVGNYTDEMIASNIDLDDMIDTLVNHYSNYWIDEMYNFRIVEIDD